MESGAFSAVFLFFCKDVTPIFALWPKTSGYAAIEEGAKGNYESRAGVIYYVG